MRARSIRMRYIYFSGAKGTNRKLLEMGGNNLESNEDEKNIRNRNGNSAKIPHE